jgi:putative ABC transport system permease protein
VTSFWLTYITRSFLRSGRRALFAVICVVVGTAGVVALQSAGLTVENALTSNIRASNGGDISLATDEVPLSRTDLKVFAQLRREGRVSRWTAVSSVHATAIGTKGRLVPFSVDLVPVPPYPLGGQPTFVGSHNGTVETMLARSGNVLVSSVLAQELGVGVGDRLMVNGIGGTGLHATVVGVLSETSFAHSAAMTAEVRDMPALTSSPPRYTAVYLNVNGSADAVASSLRNRFPTATIQTVAEALQTAHQEVHDFQQFLLTVGLLAMLIAGVGILNAMQSILARRRLEIAMLKAMGFREWTLYLLFGGEAVLIGVIGGVLGTGLGVGVGKFITDALARAQAIQVTYAVDIGTVFTGVALGIGATLVFAVMPIVRAASLRPLEVLREGIATAAGEWYRLTLLIVGVFALFTVLASIALGDALLAAEFVAGTAAACALFGGLFALVVTWLGRLGPPRSRAVGAAILLVLLIITAAAASRAPAVAALIGLGTLLFGLSVVLSRRRLLPLLIGVRSLSRRRGRSSLMLVAFLAGILSMTVSLTIAVGLQQQLLSALAANRASNLVAVGSGDSGPRILAASHGLTGVHSYTVTMTAQTEPLAINGRKVSSITGGATSNPYSSPDMDFWTLSGVTGWDLRAGELPPSLRIVVGRALAPGDAGTSHVLLNERLAGWPWYMRVGDRLTLRETGSTIVRSVRVIGFYQRQRGAGRFSALSTPPIYGDRSLALALGGPDVQTVVSFSADQSALAHDAALLQQALPGTLVIDVGDLTAIVDTILSELLQLLAVITILVLGAGVAVVANGVALAMLERRREIALFKAIGFGPSSVEGFVLTENALIGTLAGAASVLLTAIALGLLSHFALQQPIGFDPGLAVFVLVVATLVAVVTAYLSSRGPIGVRPLEALRNE